MNANQVTKIIVYSMALMALTSLHHVYGAIIYNTPWRLHVLMFSIPVVILTLAVRMFRKQNDITRSILFWVFIVITLIVSAGVIGIFEGMYNHVLKNLLFFGGASNETLQRLFPPPKYEMPNDVIFELTGVLQGFIVLPLLISMFRLFSTIFGRSMQKR